MSVVINFVLVSDAGLPDLYEHLKEQLTPRQLLDLGTLIAMNGIKGGNSERLFSSARRKSGECG